MGCDNNPSYNKLVVTPQDLIQQAQHIGNAYTKIGSAKSIIETGDLITRTGNDFTSESLRSLNRRDQTYSHCGIASIEHDSIFVYHSLGGEWNPDQKIRREPFEIFTAPTSNRGFGIFRFQLNKDEINNVITTTQQFYKEGVMFDMKFDLKTDDRMYCAEFVEKSFSKGSHNKLVFNISHINDFAFVGVDDIFLHPVCKEIKRALFK